MCHRFCRIFGLRVVVGGVWLGFVVGLRAWCGLFVVAWFVGVRCSRVLAVMMVRVPSVNRLGCGMVVFVRRSSHVMVSAGWRLLMELIQGLLMLFWLAAHTR